MSTPSTRDNHRNRVEFRDWTNPGDWQAGTLVYEGDRLTVVALDDGTTRHVYDWKHELRNRGAGQLGDNVIRTTADGTTQTGHLGICPTCDGHGNLFIPDPVQPEITEQPDAVHDLTPEAYQLLELIEMQREHGGVYLVGPNSERWITAYARTERGSWFATDSSGRSTSTQSFRYSIASMTALEAAELITVTSASTDDDYDALPGALFQAMHRNGEGRTEADWEGLGVHRPEPTSDPYGRPERTAMEPVMRAALDWLYKTEQPTGAGITQHGIGSGDLPTIPNRRIGLLPGWNEEGPIIAVKVAAPLATHSFSFRNPLAPGELDEWAEVIRDLGYDVTDTWGTDGTSGTIRLAEHQHPSLTAAYQLYLTGCTTHSLENPAPNGALDGVRSGGSLCRCAWWRTPASLLVHPTWPTPAP